MSVSPKSRSKTAWKIPALPKQALTTVSSKRPVKKEDGVLASIQPKKLFRDGGGEKSAPPAKKPVKPGRVVPSRYNQIGAGKETAATNNDARKRSLPEDEKEEGNKRGDKRRGGGVVGRSQQGAESSILRGKKRWEIPTEVVVYRSSVEDDDKDDKAEAVAGTAPPLMGGNGLPKIKNLRCVNESPRDSGPAKRVAELIGRKSFFGENDQNLDHSSVCLALSFAEEEEDEEDEAEEC